MTKSFINFFLLILNIIDKKFNSFLINCSKIYRESNFYSDLIEINKYCGVFINYIKNLKTNRVAFKAKSLNDYNTNDFSNIASKEKFLLDNEEFSNNSRFLRFDNPVFKYDYKSGDYFPKLYKDLYFFLIPSILDLTSGLRMPS